MTNDKLVVYCGYCGAKHIDVEVWPGGKFTELRSLWGRHICNDCELKASQLLQRAIQSDKDQKTGAF